MDNRIFHIDRDCFLIFAEELSSRKERFLRIGNTHSIDELNEKLTFIDLITPVLPGSTAIALDQLSGFHKCMGLKKNIDDYINMLIAYKNDISSISIVYADRPSSEKELSEKEFINQIKNDDIKTRHTFASFYSDGNIKIFNKEGVFFDLAKAVSESYSIKKEIIDMYNANLKRFQYTDKTGFIISGGSLFLFADTKYHCITSAGNWVKDATVVGINPFEIDTLLITNPIVPGYGWFEVFYEKWKAGNRLKVVSRSNNYTNNSLVYFVNPSKRTFLYESEKCNIQYQSNRLRILLGNCKLIIKDDQLNFIKGSIIDFVMAVNSQKVKSHFIIDDFAFGAFSVLTYSPVFLESRPVDNSVIKNSAIFNTIPKHIEDIIKNDSEYDSRFIIPLENIGSLQLSVIGESIRRIVADGNGKRKDISLCYKNLLKNVNGLYFRNNGVSLNQCMYEENQLIIMRDSFFLTGAEKYTTIDDVFTDFSSPTDSLHYEETFEKIKEFNISKRKKNYQNDIEHIENVLHATHFYTKEIERLKQFISELELLDRQMEHHGIPFDAPYSTLHTINHEKQTYQTDEPSLVHDGFNAKELFGDIAKEKNTIVFKVISRISGFLLILLLVLLLLFAGMRYIPFSKITHVFKQFGTVKDNISNKSISKIKKLKPVNTIGKRSIYYSFYMTYKDRIDITNKIAIANGYRRLLFPFEINHSYGKSPDWIYPGNVLVMPDQKRVVVKEGDVLWRICETYLYEQMNRDEKIIVDTIKKVEKKELEVAEARIIFMQINSNSDSEMLRAFSALIMIQDNLSDWVYIDNRFKKF
ncbi:MAG: hypothetical protein A2015_13740 [Spirochaetes bacterium GWF1_31_7]|nr:MAG: hypothetical protein A2Y30_11085 [Spirochaetes bacterium GWE1_32_154]OHD47701.1 MAG: hypothetical protein A2Y29_05050 [Spirochaetes bacterium GWE2_31_10]OHD49880.1 MAG: hypothetical protein A2015_13740 [Spirochaetes bacterium GWF1_31_7]HBD96291.1 hypothetical protein [Spirochaetia bacterium]HBI37747.1 hypothetical protein [Spirochaetia bacterium]